MNFELRQLKATDMFPMFGILSKIGFKDLKKAMSPEMMTQISKAMKGENKEESATMIGFSIIAEVVEIIMTNLPSCEKEIFTFLSNISGMTVREISNLDMVTFTEMIIAVIKKDEFKDFFKVVSGLFK